MERDKQTRETDKINTYQEREKMKTVSQTIHEQVATHRANESTGTISAYEFLASLDRRSRRKTTVECSFAPRLTVEHALELDRASSHRLNPIEVRRLLPASLHTWSVGHRTVPPVPKRTVVLALPSTDTGTHTLYCSFSKG